MTFCERVAYFFLRHPCALHLDFLHQPIYPPPCRLQLTPPVHLPLARLPLLPPRLPLPPLPPLPPLRILSCSTW